MMRLCPPHWPARCALRRDRPAGRGRPGGRAGGGMAARAADRRRSAGARHHDRLRAGARSRAAGVHRRDRRSGAERRSRAGRRARPRDDRGLSRRRRAAGDQASAGAWPRPRRQPPEPAGGRCAERAAAAHRLAAVSGLPRRRRSRSPRMCGSRRSIRTRPATLSAARDRRGDPRRAGFRGRCCSATTSAWARSRARSASAPRRRAPPAAISRCTATGATPRWPTCWRRPARSRARRQRARRGRWPGCGRPSRSTARPRKRGSPRCWRAALAALGRRLSHGHRHDRSRALGLAAAGRGRDHAARGGARLDGRALRRQHRAPARPGHLQPAQARRPVRHADPAGHPAAAQGAVPVRLRQAGAGQLRAPQPSQARHGVGRARRARRQPDPGLRRRAAAPSRGLSAARRSRPGSARTWPTRSSSTSCSRCSTCCRCRRSTAAGC